MQMPRNAEYCYAVKGRLRDYLDLGWLLLTDLGEWSVLAVWLCECRPAVLPCR
jgi:hypothetical protein